MRARRRHEVDIGLAKVGGRERSVRGHDGFEEDANQLGFKGIFPGLEGGVIVVRFCGRPVGKFAVIDDVSNDCHFLVVAIFVATETK